MNHTVELLEKIEKSFREGTLTQEQIPFDAIREAVSTEIGLNRNTFQREQYECVVTRWNKICDDFVASGADKTQILLFLDAAILCIHMISELMKISTRNENFIKFYILNNAKYNIKTVVKSAVFEADKKNLLSLADKLKIRIMLMYGVFRPYFRCIYCKFFKNITTR